MNISQEIEDKIKNREIVYTTYISSYKEEVLEGSILNLLSGKPIGRFTSFFINENKVIISRIVYNGMVIYEAYSYVKTWHKSGHIVGKIITEKQYLKLLLMFQL